MSLGGKSGSWRDFLELEHSDQLAKQLNQQALCIGHRFRSNPSNCWWVVLSPQNPNPNPSHILISELHSSAMARPIPEARYTPDSKPLPIPRATQLWLWPAIWFSLYLMNEKPVYGMGIWLNGWVSTCKACIPYWSTESKPWLLYFQASFRIWILVDSRPQPMCLAPCHPCGRPRLRSDLLILA